MYYLVFTKMTSGDLSTISDLLLLRTLLGSYIRDFDMRIEREPIKVRQPILSSHEEIVSHLNIFCRLIATGCCTLIKYPYTNDKKLTFFFGFLNRTLFEVSFISSLNVSLSSLLSPTLCFSSEIFPKSGTF